MKKEDKGVKEKYKKELAIGLWIGAMVGLFVYLGTQTANFLWWFQQQRPDTIAVWGWTHFVAFIVMAVWLSNVAIRNIK